MNLKCFCGIRLTGHLIDHDLDYLDEIQGLCIIAMIVVVAGIVPHDGIERVNSLIGVIDKAGLAVTDNALVVLRALWGMLKV